MLYSLIDQLKLSKLTRIRHYVYDYTLTLTPIEEIIRQNYCQVTYIYRNYTNFNFLLLNYGLLYINICLDKVYPNKQTEKNWFCFVKKRFDDSLNIEVVTDRKTDSRSNGLC